MTLLPDVRCTLAQRADADEIIDVRSPAEFAEDHLPGARNFPVLNNEERVAIGTLYQNAPFEARKTGAAMVARHIAHYLDNEFVDRPKNWRPLVYCWRGGMRSASFVTWLRLIGWRAMQLTGGYKTWRRHVLQTLGDLPPRFRWRVICGPTGSAKTRLLAALATCGEQTLDLEALAAHKGSVLGALPDTSQPSQKAFETHLSEALSTLDPARPVYVEAESRKIGRVALPNALIDAMRSADCLELLAPPEARLRYLLDDYAYLGHHPQSLCERLERLKGFIDNDTLARWQQWAQNGNLPDLFSELLTRHYDPLYTHSQYRHFSKLHNAPRFHPDDLSDAALAMLAKKIVQETDWQK
ncbi:MAG: tRNA 2-selenouridine(34) synthase MnmH [Burkholderiales bacterium]|jgi:tRNA 2-selenouridine synthase|nr:tRNA 2-selenouridine(34) synthase MnmH [Burkholderiales bacterium]